MKQERSGFALAVVVFLLFAIGMASATGYTVVALEADMSVQGEEVAEATTIARAGLERYFGEHIGVPRDTTAYAIGNGTVYISAKRTATVDEADGIYMYLVTARAEVANLSNGNAPAVATAQQFAMLHEEPIARTAALVGSYATVDLRGTVNVSGGDASGGWCTGSTENTYGVAHRGALTTGCQSGNCASATGSPGAGVNLGTHAAVYDTAGIRWDILTDPTFPVDYVNTFPGWGFGYEDFPVIRWEGNLNANSTHSGRGVLIVTGEFAIDFCCFQWEGIILAGDIDSSGASIDYMWLRGMLVGGLDGGGGTLLFRNAWLGPQIQYDQCSALYASNALAWWEPLDDTFEEVQ